MEVNLDQANYMLNFNAEQLDYLCCTKYGAERRVQCLFHLIAIAEMESKTIEKKGIKAVVPPGAVEIPHKELAAILKCDRKTVMKMLKEMNDLGLIESTSNYRTSIHRLKCLQGWSNETYSVYLQ